MNRRNQSYELAANVGIYYYGPPTKWETEIASLHSTTRY